MKSCDDCPGSNQCSGQNLHPVLVQVYDLYDSGMRDKFDILLALGDDDEAILERYTVQVSQACWTKAALLAIAEVVMRIADSDLSSVDAVRRVYATVTSARDAFSMFPWRLDALVEEAPELYALLVEKCPNETLCQAFSKRAFVKMCKDVVYA